MDNTPQQEWMHLQPRRKQNILSSLSKALQLPADAIEKDWWVVQTLRLIFEMDCANRLVFKGGTSLSKAWKLINRFSEDIDLALDRKYLGYTDEMTISQIKKLRKSFFLYASETFFPLLKEKFRQAGFEGIEVQLAEVRDTDQDPLIIEIYYPSVSSAVSYIRPRVLVEIGSRSLIEPNTIKTVSSMIAESYPESSFADMAIQIPTVNPERTFLEKIFLLHEEFQKPVDKMRVDRLTRHLYDIERLMDTEFAEKALADVKLYQDIVAHRRLFTPIRGIDYENHIPQKINPIPPPELVGKWQKDYEIMQSSMIYGESLAFSKLIERMEELKRRLQNMTATPSLTIDLKAEK
jgi:predicted nucleotidyltransferase component of viral defense system